jgi:adenylate cyclase class IV
MIEIEIKCDPTAEQTVALLKNAVLVSEEILNDVYYDSLSYALSIRDLWLRKRNGNFTLKKPVPISSTLANQRYELETEKEIRRELNLPDHTTLEQEILNAGYNPLYKFTQYRKKYSKEGFTIDIDRLKFNSYCFDRCEIELLVEKPEDVTVATKNLIAFTERHAIKIIPVDAKKGKLATLIKLVNPEHFKLLEQANAKKLK